MVAFLESRRSAEMASLIARHGGTPYPVPCLREEHHPEADAVALAVEQLCGDAIDMVIFLTGVGVETILEGARQHGRLAEVLDGLARKQVVTRGPKPVAALRRTGVRVDVEAPPPHTSREVTAALADTQLRGRTVLVQLYGGPNAELRQQLEQRGAHVLEVAPYVWRQPADPAGVLRVIDDLGAGRVQALAVTSAAQVDNLFAIAAERGRTRQLRDGLAKVMVAAQGPVCAAALERYGVAVGVQPTHGHMGALVLAIARGFIPDRTPARPGAAGSS